MTKYRLVSSASKKLICAIVVAILCQGGELWADPVDEVLKPLWVETATVRETVQFIQETPASPKTAKLTFIPSEILSVKSAAWVMDTQQRIYELNKDVKTTSGSSLLIADANSSIPAMKRADFHPAKGVTLVVDPKKPLDTKPESSIKLAMSNNLDQLRQIEVAYKHQGDAWRSWKPQPAVNELPQTLSKLQGKQPLNILLLGDSITEGLGSTDKSKINPSQPCYGTLLAEALKRRYAYQDVDLSNQAHAGWSIGNGVNQVDQPKGPNVMTPETNLVIIAYGMNDADNGVNTNWDIYKARLKIHINDLRKINPHVEFILVTPMLGNPEWAHTSLPFFTCVPQHSGYSSLQQTIREMAGTYKGVAVADVTAVWIEMLKRKGWQYQDLLDGKPLTGWYDLTANGLNHPNDFGHMLYLPV